MNTQSQKYIALYSCLFVCSIEAVYFNFQIVQPTFYAIILLISNIYLHHLYRSDPYLSFVFLILIWMNYSVVVLQLGLIAASYNGLYASLNNTAISVLGLRILFYFLLLLLIFTLIIRKRSHKKIKEIENSFNILFIVVTFATFFTIISADYIMNTGIFPKSVYEYSIIFLIFALVLSRRISHLAFSITIAAGILAVLGNVLSGDRIVGLQFSIVLYLLYFRERLSKKVVIFIASVGIVFLSYTGSNREGFSITDIQGMIQSLYILSDRMVTLDTSFSAYFTGLRILEFMGQLDAVERIRFFLHFLGSLLLGSLYPYEQANLAVYTFNLGFVHSYGSFLPVLSFFYLGFFGVMLTTFGLIYFFCKNGPRHSLLLEIVIIYFCATLFRWYLYSPVMLIRGLFFIVIIYLISRPFLTYKRAT